MVRCCRHWRDHGGIDNQPTANMERILHQSRGIFSELTRACGECTIVQGKSVRWKEGQGETTTEPL